MFEHAVCFVQACGTTPTVYTRQTAGWDAPGAIVFVHVFSSFLFVASRSDFSDPDAETKLNNSFMYSFFKALRCHLSDRSLLSESCGANAKR